MKSKRETLAFNLGELDSESLARTDLEIYDRGAEIMENCLPVTRGALIKAPGTEFVVEASNADAYLYPWVFNEYDAKVLLFDAFDLQILTDQGFEKVDTPLGELGAFSAWSNQSAILSPGGAAAPDGGSGDIDYSYVPPDLGFEEFR